MIKKLTVCIALQSKRESGEAKRSVSSAPSAPISVGRRDVLDSLNLNVDGEQGLTMTFVEELDD